MKKPNGFLLLRLSLALAFWPALLPAQQPASGEKIDDATLLLRRLLNQPAAAATNSAARQLREIAPPPAEVKSDPSPATPEKAVVETPAPLAVPKPESLPPSDEPVGVSVRNYVLAPNDVVHIRVFKEDNLETKARIANDGTITFPLIGTIRIGGRTAEQASALITELLDRDYIVKPQVTMDIMEFAKRRFTILGQVQKPGAYELPETGSLNLLQAISMAGGYTRIAAPGKVTVQRDQEGKKATYNVDAKAMAKDKETELFEIKADDVITIGESIF